MQLPISKIEFYNMVPNNGTILEIGPYASPIFKRPMFNVFYADILTSDQIKEECIRHNRNYSDVPDCIDILVNVDTRPTLSSNIKFTTIFSSHNIEHHPDLINHLQEVSNVAEHNARFYLAIPDKRYSLDHWHAETTIADVIAAHIEERKNHTMSTHLNNILFTAEHNEDESLHWIGEHGPDLKLPTIDQNYIGKIKHGISTIIAKKDRYTDQHNWYFTPKTFEHIFNLLEKLNYSDWILESIYNTRPGSHEFYAILRKK